MREIVTNNLQTMRGQKKLTQEEVAIKVGVSRQTIIAIEKGNYTPSVLLAIKLAKVFSLSVDDIFFISYEK
jgi:putative transcriptional regulator